MHALATPGDWNTIPKTGTGIFLSPYTHIFPDHALISRIPENCAFTAVSHPEGLTSPTQIMADSPRPYTQLNSGTVVLNPSLELASGIKEFLQTSPLVATFSFPDQDLLAAYFFGKWRVLPWCYNALKTLRQIHKPLWRDDEARCVHYIFAVKPWHQLRGTSGEYEEVNSWWWDCYERLGEDMQVSDPEGWVLVDAQVAKPT